MKRIITLVCMLCLLCCGCSGPNADTLQSYTAQTGITLQMQAGMRLSAEDSVSCLYSGQSCMMSALREEFADYAQMGHDPQAMTVEDYAHLVQQANDLQQTFLPDENGNLHVTYTNTSGNTEYFYYATVRKGSDAFWVVNFACNSRQKDAYLPLFIRWSDTIAVP